MSTSAEETFTDRNGLVWHNGGAETDDHLAFGGHEPGLVEIAKGMLPEGGTFLDIGAHVGLYTLNLADKAGFVVAIEANPETHKVLVSNVQANVRDDGPIPHAKVATANFAAWDRFEELSMVDENGKSTGGSTRCTSQGGVKEALSWTTQGMPLDDVLLGVPKIDFVKIDVEGAEARVLSGMKERLKVDRPILLIEMHDMYFGEQVRTDTIAVLEELDYAWSDDLTFGISYYIVATEKQEFEIEIVRAGE